MKSQVQLLHKEAQQSQGYGSSLAQVLPHTGIPKPPGKMSCLSTWGMLSSKLPNVQEIGRPSTLFDNLVTLKTMFAWLSSSTTVPRSQEKGHALGGLNDRCCPKMFLQASPVS